MRLILDAQTMWAFTGIAFRISRRIGLHRDGTQLGLPPFDVEMRRRLWFQLIILDHTSAELAGLAPELSGSGMVKAWDTFRPSNLNDSDLHPDMKELPAERVGATEMIFCLLRYEFGAFFRRTGYVDSNLKAIATRFPRSLVWFTRT
jgi:Fungal specific transcription factor domain